MTAGGEGSTPLHLPLRQLALCLDCDECFDSGLTTCPACGSATWTSLARLLERGAALRRPQGLDASPSEARPHDDPPERIRQLIIVAGNRAHLYEHFKIAFAGNKTVRVLLDRRVAERRQHSGPHEAERREGDRRSPLTIEGLLRTIGWAIVPLGVPERPRGSSP